MSKYFRNFMNSLTVKERINYLASANRVTVGTITTVEDKSIVKRYVAKIHGLIISPESKEYMFFSRQDAIDYGKEALERFKRLSKETEVDE